MSTSPAASPPEQPAQAPVPNRAPSGGSWEERHLHDPVYCPFCRPQVSFLTGKTLRQHARRKHGVSSRAAKLLSEALAYEAANGARR